MSDEGRPVVIYGEGLLYLSVCAKDYVSIRDVERYVNTIHPSGTTSGWRISDNEKFRTGETNPCVCENDSTRKHYLLEC